MFLKLVDLKLEFLKSLRRKNSKLSLIKASKTDIRNSKGNNKMKQTKQYSTTSACQLNLPVPKMGQNID